MQIQASDGWEDLIPGGDFEAIPDPFRFRESLRFAYLIDGYQIAGSFEALSDLATATGKAAGAAGMWFGDAATLWLTLFFEHRRYRHFGTPPTGDTELWLDELCQTLRNQLLAIPPEDRGVFLSQLMPASATS